LLSSEYHFSKGTKEGTAMLQAVTMQSIRYDNTKTFFKKENKLPMEKLSRELVFLVKVFGCVGELNIKCDHQKGGFYVALMNATNEYNQKTENADQQMPDFLDEANKSMACSQFGQLWRKLKNQVKDNFGGIRQHQNFSERYTDIHVPKAAPKTERVAKSRPKKDEPKDQNTGVAMVLVSQVEQLKAEMDALKAQKLVEKGASPANKKTAHVVNMNLNAKAMMTTVQRELFSTANEMTSADDINRLYHLQYLGRVAMDIAQKVCSREWLRLTFPDLPETEILEVQLYDLSAEIKKCLTKKCVENTI
jgi:hypothetical protein